MSRVLLAAGLAVVVSTAAYAATLPVKVLNAQQAAQLGAYTQVPLSGANFSTSALISVQSKAKTLTDVKRNGPAVSAAYAGVSAFPISPPPTPVTSAAPPSSEVFNFKLAGDSAQGWATTTPQGMPFLFTQAYGQSVAAGTASWRAQVTVTAQSPNLYVQFMLPAAQVTGVTEENGPSNWQSRLRADLQLNGHPVWSSEASRISLLNGQASSNDNCFEHDEKAQYLSTFGQGLGFTPAANVNSTARIVTLWLGTFPAGQTVDVAFIVRTDAQVMSPCCPHDANNKPEQFCTRATAGVTWDTTQSPVKFWIGPNAP